MSENYARMQLLFASDPDLWGGAYAEGDLLVVKFVSQSLEEAQAVLRSQEVVRGVRLVEVEVSLSDLEKAQKAVDEILKRDSRAVSWGPDYASSSIHVEVTTTDVKLLGTLRQAVAGIAGVEVVSGAKRGTLELPIRRQP